MGLLPSASFNLPARLFRGLDRVADHLGLFRRPVPPEKLVDLARRRSGLDDFGEWSFEEPLAVLVRLSPSLVTLPWLQDLALVAGEGIALAWMCELIAARHARGRQSVAIPVALVALAIVLNFYNNHMTVDVDTAEELKG